ncbi:hypothetical protein CSB45_16155 [candidate division KSB3 bacterium]|uniref:TRAP transporter T-component n=1 Tax=candidate division KSB3 bacterium TaxID=2044937 RepID=A0A2G6E025_9BACT|nr:MAG: hypothetical protein CSB45_16155 [candidate division KSB3 bacterium]
MKQNILISCALVLVLLLSSCANLINSRIIQPAVGNLQQQTDLELVCDGAPAYLLMLDSMLAGNPADPNLLITAAQSYSGYGASVAECSGQSLERIQPIVKKAKQYGKALLATKLPLAEGLEAIETSLSRQTEDDVPALFWGAFGWLSWIREEQGSPESVADIVIIEKIMTRLLELQPDFQGGSIHIFWGVYHAAKPAMFGGKPELSREHFEKALSLSKRQFLMAQVNYAQTYCRATFNQTLHDKLLQEVLEFDIALAPEFALSNQLAKRKAQKLLDENYFGE